MSLANANMEGNIIVTVVRGSGVKFKIVHDDIEPNRIEQRAKDLVMASIVTGDQWAGAGQATTIQSMGSNASGTNSGNHDFTVAGTVITNTTANHETHPATPEANWEPITNTSGFTTSSDWQFKLMAADGTLLASKLTANGDAFSPSDNVYPGDKFRVVWNITVSGLESAGNACGASGIVGTLSNKAAKGKAGTNAALSTGAITGGVITNAALSGGTATCNFQFPGDQAWLNASTQAGLISSGGATYCSGSIGGQKPADNSRVQFTFELTAS